jgi:putative transcriptional regulator
MDGWGGHLLIAPAWMTDPNFAHSVVLLLHHDDSGAFGLVLNRPTGTSVGEVWKQATGGRCALDAAVFLGGPVPGPLLALHDRVEAADRMALDGVYMTSDPERLAALLADPPEALRVFAGYSGWGEGQLEHELQDAAWVTTPARTEDVFLAPIADIWRTALHRATGEIHDPLGRPGAAPEASPDTN